LNNRRRRECFYKFKFSHLFQIAVAVWLFYLTKFFELLDTIFFMLRKKNNQLSFLHVYHHSTMFVFSWIGTKYVPGGSAFLPILINSFVHIIMYLYYTLAAMHCTKIMKYKKFVTIIQLVNTHNTNNTVTIILKLLLLSILIHTNKL
jgi:hypothetical protein